MWYAKQQFSDPNLSHDLGLYSLCECIFMSMFRARVTVVFRYTYSTTASIMNEKHTAKKTVIVIGAGAAGFYIYP